MAARRRAKRGISRVALPCVAPNPSRNRLRMGRWPTSAIARSARGAAADHPPVMRGKRASGYPVVGRKMLATGFIALKLACDCAKPSAESYEGKTLSFQLIQTTSFCNRQLQTPTAGCTATGYFLYDIASSSRFSSQLLIALAQLLITLSPLYMLTSSLLLPALVSASAGVLRLDTLVRHRFIFALLFTTADSFSSAADHCSFLLNDDVTADVIYA
ncbi:hypothetical protein F511_35252 [Dorcoceras hygrometricum]|uniref:Uncharacterized protein n=1 Tax=Dorcoceras hygrometricum TaxID=472368 RepID=A0A2Z7D8I0_9LAMI|nr:hypothetical protein F511_35252 [Dorcoceras hygrometricum]